MPKTPPAHFKLDPGGTALGHQSEPQAGNYKRAELPQSVWARFAQKSCDGHGEIASLAISGRAQQKCLANHPLDTRAHKLQA